MQPPRKKKMKIECPQVSLSFFSFFLSEHWARRIFSRSRMICVARYRDRSRRPYTQEWVLVVVHFAYYEYTLSSLYPSTGICVNGTFLLCSVGNGWNERERGGLSTKSSFCFRWGEKVGPWLYFCSARSLFMGIMERETIDAFLIQKLVADWTAAL